jgi:AraC family transcriptional regulator, ethanolamine operon transcriptional activator
MGSSPEAATGEIGSHTRGRFDRYDAGFTISIDTDDFDEFCNYTVGWRIDHQAVATRQVKSAVFGVQTSATQLAMVEHSQGYCSHGETPPGGHTFFLSLDASRPVQHRGRPIALSEIGCARGAAEFELAGRRGSRHLVASIAEKLLDEQAFALFGRPFSLRHGTDRYFLSKPASRSRYQRGALQLLETISRRPALLGTRSVVAAIETKLSESLLLALSGDARIYAAPHRHQLARCAHRYMLERLGEVASITELCQATGGNYASLERGFRELYGLTPQAYLHAARFLRARRDLLEPQPSTTVTGVALRWGFLELGRFSVQYRRRFGESPSETIRRVRGRTGVDIRITLPNSA